MMQGGAPAFVHGSLDNPRAKRVRPRGASISGRLRSASDLCEEGIITAAEKGMMKDLIISEDPKLNDAFDGYERGGDISRLLSLLGDGHIARRKSSIDLMEGELDIGALNVGSLGSDHGKFLSADDIHFFEGPFDVSAPTTEPGAQFSFSPYGGGDTFDVDEAQPSEPTAPTRRFSFGSVSRLPMMSSDKDKGASAEPASTGRDRLPSFGFGGLDSLGGFGSFLEPGGLSGVAMEDLPLGSPPTMGEGGLHEAPNPFTTPAAPLAPTSDGRHHMPATSGASSASKPIGIPGASTTADRKMLEYRRRQGYGSVGGEEEVDIIGGVGPIDAPLTSVGGDLSAGPHAAEGGRGTFRIGAYSPQARAAMLERFMDKRKKRQWKRKVKYGVRKDFADSRLRVKGRFVKKTDEELLRDFMFMV